MITSFSEWFSIREEDENNQKAVEVILEALSRPRPDISNQDWQLSQREEKRSARPGDVIITSAHNFLSRKSGSYNLRVADFNFMIVSPASKVGETVTAVGSRKAGKSHKNIQQDFDRGKLYDVTRAFIDDPFKQPNQRIYVFVKNESENILKLLDKRTKEMSGNVTMGHRADTEDRKNQEDYFKNMQSMGVHPDQIAHMWRKKQAEKLKNAQRASSLSTGTIPMQQQAPVDDLNDRISKFKQQPTTNPINDDEWNRRLAAAKSNF